MNTPPDHEEVAERWPTAAVILAGASLFELIGACLVCGEGACEGLEAYAVSVGVVSLVLLAPIVLLLFAEPLAPPRLHEGLPHLSLMLLAWWVPAAFLLTFVAPFQRLCNGYFSALAAAASAVELSRAHVPAIDAAFRALRAAIASSTERACVCSLAATSTMMWAQAAISLAEYPKEHAATKTWAVLVGLVSMLLCGFYLCARLCYLPAMHPLQSAAYTRSPPNGCGRLALCSQSACRACGASLPVRHRALVVVAARHRAFVRSQRVHLFHEWFCEHVGVRIFGCLLSARCARPSGSHSNTIRTSRRGRPWWAHHHIPRSSGAGRGSYGRILQLAGSHRHGRQ